MTHTPDRRQTMFKHLAATLFIATAALTFIMAMGYLGNM